MAERRREDGRRAGLARMRGMATAGFGPLRDEKKMRQMIYFAYGSNLDDVQMRTRCASARALGRAVLPNHALTFGGFSHRWNGAVASVVRARGARVEGLLYSLDVADVQTLDRFEGHPFAYERVVREVIDEQSRRRRVATYVQPEDGLEPWSPPRGYFEAIRRAYDRLGFDTAPLVAAAGGLP